jgi:cell division protein FtsL
MAKRIEIDISELVTRAESDAKSAGSSRQITAQPSGQLHSSVRGGAPEVQARKREPTVPHGNERTAPTKKRRSTFNIIVGLFLAAVAIVFYIGNILKVNRLAVEVHQLQIQYEKVQNANRVLQAEINRKSGWERIGSAAMQQGLIHASQKPQALDVDEEKLDEFKEK